MVYAVLVAASGAGCGSDAGAPATGEDAGVETGGSSFSTSACKKDEKISLSRAHVRGLKVIQDESGLAGLRCVAWQRLANALKVDLYNFDGACGSKWTGDAAVLSDGTLALDIRDPSCAFTACGECLYDWSFDLNTSVASGVRVPATITVDPCERLVPGSTLTEVIGDEDQGIHCMFADFSALNLQAGATGTRGTSGMPCAGAAESCSEGLICDSSAAANQPRCLVSCANDVDCPRTDVWSCQSGLCRPKP